MTTQEQHELESGQVLNTHNESECRGQWCAIHLPMPGPWSEWPRMWREDRGIMERICPCGIGHPVAEMYDWAIENGRGFELVHGCCAEHICSTRTAKRDAFIHSGLSREHHELRIGIPDSEAPKEIVAASELSLDEQEQASADVWLMVEAMNLMIELWPNPSYASVTIESHQWARLRKVLSQVPTLIERLSPR